VNETKVKVCKAVFLSTLNIGEKMVSYTLNHAITNTGQASGDRRGRHPPGIKKAPALLDSVREHISSFPVMESHYARKNTSKKFLDSTLNIRKMYNLYVEQRTTQKKEYVSEKLYGNIFRNDFNLGFHHPKKDQCNFCTKFQHSSQSEKVALMDEYKKHMARKMQSRLEKEKCKQVCKSDPSVAAVAFDLQQVLCCPKINVSALYYKRKLSTYDLTVYNLGDKSVICYMWHEGIAGRGSCEIATCLSKYVQTLPQTVRKLVFFSDTCGGQNRNQNFSAMCLYTVTDYSTNTECIEHLYFESGHSQMECDSVHSAIENACRHQNIYAPTDYYSVVRSARRNSPYEVVVMGTEMFSDYRSLSQILLKNKTKATDGNVVNWLKVKWFKYERQNPTTIFYKYDYTEEFRMIDVTCKRRGRKAAAKGPKIRPLYTEPPKISAAKHADLLSLCKERAIPSDYHPFYEALIHDVSVKDTLPEADVDDDDADVVE